jgi:uncharacterized protein (DUF2249 family)
MTEHLLNVSRLEPPEPLERVLAALESLGPGEYLRVLHSREPYLLYPILDERGFVWHTRPGGEVAFEIYIWRRDDAQAQKVAEQRVAASKA